MRTTTNMIKSLAQITQHKALFSCNKIGQRSISVFSFVQAPEKSNQTDSMEKQTVKQQSNTNDDVTAHSFGEGYATRSDEEGFGGTNALSFNEAAAKIQQDKKMIHENHPAYDKTQGSEVAEKEIGRHQKSSC